MLSFLIASFMTTSASILAMLLDQAFDAKGHFTLRAPLTYFRDHFVSNEWKKHYAWRPFLDPLIIGFGDQQLVTGYAVLLTGWIKVFFFLLSSFQFPTNRYADRWLIGRTINLPRTIRTLRTHTLHRRPFVIVSPRRTYHTAKILPQIQIHSEDSTRPRRLVCGFLAYQYAGSDRLATGTRHR